MCFVHFLRLCQDKKKDPKASRGGELKVTSCGTILVERLGATFALSTNMLDLVNTQEQLFTANIFILLEDIY